MGRTVPTSSSSAPRAGKENPLARQRFGAHMSVAGGIENAFRAGADAGCDCLQIFVKNQRQWNAPPLTEQTIDACRKAAEHTGLKPVVAHATYLLNLASPDTTTRERSISALANEVDRCSRLSVPYLVLHPGAHKGDGVDVGIERIIDGLDQVAAKTASDDVCVLLETTAGQGTAVGCEIEHLGRIIDGAKMPERLGACVDTCHVFAAGYDIRTHGGYERMIHELIAHVGLDRVRCIHVNDSLRACGSRVDRHVHIGKGEIGKAGFANLVNDPRLAGVPKILETPKGRDARGTDLDRVNLKRLRNLIKTDR